MTVFMRQAVPKELESEAVTIKPEEPLILKEEQ